MELYKGKYFEVVFEDWCQEFPGACIISGHKKELSEMSSEEWQELGLLERELERVCKRLFNSTMFNFACLMNNAYRDNEEPHVHFWFVPRYKEKIKLFDKEYEDKVMIKIQLIDSYLETIQLFMKENGISQIRKEEAKNE